MPRLIDSWAWNHPKLISARDDGLEVALNTAAGRAGLDDALLRVFSEPLRARIVRLLAQEQLCPCHLVELTGARQTNISNHLRVLREAGVVVDERVGRFTYYRLHPELLARLSVQFSELAAAAGRAGQVRRPCE
ncbi:MAG TPA: metalloregulator ArsR/SmtB family transcription factor [Pseudonocardiaceae bacterium]